ncbi:hypothetical protein PYW07_016407 [Mythimna separata]|uniref:Uncharacterized protein n=1 Tax=Mythimna separata TaxID=271217 RepID=A0AAD7YLK8_MYTSE|nr:hypothetical protein PYW07_016407 [Mythimna separata]
MAPKKEKRSEPSETEWQTTIEEAPLDEDNWKVKVILIESAGGEQERMYLNKFEIFAAEEKRFVIKNICKTETIFMINQLGAEKKVKDPKLRVFEECQSYLSDKRDIPPDLLALVIKYLILKMKDEYLFISQQRLEVKRGISRESATMLDKTEVKGTVGSARKDEQHAHPVKGKGKGDGESAGHLETLEGKKFNTQLRIRGEEWRDKVYVDDYPTDGPNLYVAVTGFVEPYLPGSLVRLGIPLTAVVQIRIDPSKVGVPSNLLKATKRGQSLTEILGEKSMKFWDDLQLLRIQDDSADDYKNTAFIVFTPPYWSKDDLSGNPDRIYDELCFLMYDIQDLSRQHLHYKENMSIIDVPEDYINHYFNELYEQKNDDLPLECVTIYSILDSILQTVCDPSLDDVGISGSSVSSATTAASNPKNDSKIEDDKLENTENLVKQIFTTLWNTGAGKKKYRLTYGREYEENREPVVLRYGDFAKYNTFHLGNINLDNIVATSLVGMPINNLWRNQPRPSDEHEAKINFHVNVLLSCFDRTDVETAELNRLVNILACRKLYINRSSLKKCHLPPTTIAEFKKKYLKRSVLAEPLPKRPSLVASGPLLSSSFPSMTRSENEYEYACSQPEIDPEARRYRLMFECPDISQLVTVTEIENNQPMRHNMIDDFDFFEDLSGIRAQQVLREAFNHFNCVDYKYCEVTDCFILMFFNSHNNEGIAREEWRSHLTTPVCLQDFFDFVMDEQYEWIQTEEKIYDDNMLMDAFSISKDVFDPHALKSCIETTDVEMDLLMEGSLKYEEYVKVVEAPTETSEFTSSFIMKVVPVTVPVSDTKINKKKPTSARNAITKFFKQSVIEKVNESVEIPAKPFLGYDLGDRRVEVFGKEAIFFSRDGTKVTTMYTLTIPINLEYIILNILPDEPSKIVETKYFHSLYVSWPNGLITETVYDDNSPVISHIKQYHTRRMPHLDEEMSTITINSVNETICVESPNGTKVIVDKSNKYEINLDDKTSATFDGEDLNISYEACSECRAFTNCNVSIMKNKESSHNLTSANVEQVWLNMTDSFDKKLVVNEEGDIILSDEPPSSDKLHVQRMNMEYENKNASDTDVKEPDINSESFLVSHEKSKDMHLAKNLRFFILRRDLNCAELLHRGLVEEYKRDCRSHPWCFIKQYDTFGGHRKLASILTPVHVTEPEKWLMESKQAKKPRYKARKDLKPKAGKGKGFYHWMRPYERYVAQPITPDNVLPERLPRAYILRILEREWDGENRRELMGARELIQAVLRYRCIMEADRETILNIPVIDLRVEDERRIDDIIKVLAHKIYQELKCRIAEDIQSRARLSITTQPLLKSVDISVEGEEERDDTKCSEEERESLVKESEPAEEMRPTLKRYWRRRAEEYKEEQFYKYLLREGSVPPYFRNVLGGAIWWEVNNATAEAVTLAERRKMKCVCTENMGNT